MRRAAPITPRRATSVAVRAPSGSVVSQPRPRPINAPTAQRSVTIPRRAYGTHTARQNGPVSAPFNSESFGVGALIAAAVVAGTLWNEAQAEEGTLYPGEGASASDKANWRHQIVGRYENRLREFSTPEKIFQYFASVAKNGERFMTPMDFLRAITPFDYRGATPVGTNHARWAVADNRKGSGGAGLLSMGSLTASVPKLSVPEIFKLADVNGDGLISFDVFFTTLLAIPQHHIKLAFRMFDENGDGEVDQQEFKRVMSVLRGETPMAQRSSALNSHEVDSTGLFSNFFGVDGKKKLKSTEFQAFIRQLHDGILDLEFRSFDPTATGTISAHDFALSIASFGHVAHLNAYLTRIDALSLMKERFTFKQFSVFNRVLGHLDEVHTAMNLAARNGCTRSEFKRAALIGTGEQLDDATVEVVFAVFDKNRDGRLDPSEFYEILKSRQSRGLHSSRDIGAVNFLYAFTIGCFVFYSVWLIGALHGGLT